ncbi:response regulator transcription factor [Rhodococcus gannanensis]|jgi:DNA-binding CsgD family transcriptional regulator|uniref:Response regulator transcription factor n=1 Tax=Rhodococcus gannanensis TaxID=1960308 RepID=A0ABW4P966_9NOCA
MTFASIDHLRRPMVHPASREPHPMSRGLRRPHLSPREIEVLLHWLRCDSKNEVAAGLFLSIGTVNTHLARIRAKYRDVGRSAPTKAALVARAVQDGLIELHEL